MDQGQHTGLRVRVYVVIIVAAKIRPCVAERWDFAKVVLVSWVKLHIQSFRFQCVGYRYIYTHTHIYIYARTRVGSTHTHRFIG